MRVVRIESGVVVNAEEWAELPESGDGVVYVASAVAGPGWTWDGQVLAAPPTPTPPVPDLVPMYKVRKLLIKRDMLAAVEAAVAALSGQSGDLARVDWQYSPNLVRLSPLVQGLGAAIGLSPDQIDALVVAADAIP